MPRQRQVELNEATSNAIKATARQLMAEKGTAGLSLRAIARELKLTAPALYHYFPSLDDLITALIVDAFTGHATYVRQQRDAAAAVGKAYREQLFVATQAYRQWALDHPIDFQLVYGNPLPGYVAPAEVTVPAARSLGQVFMEILVGAVKAGDIDMAPFTAPIPPTVRTHYQHHFGLDEAGAQIFQLMNHVWCLMHGMVALEIYNHAAPVVGDTTAFYEQAIRQQFRLMGIALP